MKTKHKYDEDWHSLFLYDETSPSCLRWKVDVRCGRGYNRCHVFAGDIAGSLNGAGYWQVKVNKKSKQVHRIIVEICGICCEGMEVDHINKITTDNRIVNLRVVTKSLNLHNRNKYSNNKTGVNGVAARTKVFAGRPYEFYVATWQYSAYNKGEKWFSCKKYGCDEAFQLACDYRSKMIAELNEQGAGYTENHGK